MTAAQAVQVATWKVAPRQGKTKPAFRVPNLVDLILVRMGEYSRLIAGLALAWPLEVLEATDRVPAEMFRDERARGYLLTLRAHRSELESAAEPFNVSVELADASPDCIFLIDQAATAAIVVPFSELGELVKELQRMANAAATVQKLAAEFPEDGRLDYFREGIHQAIKNRGEV